MLGRVETQNHKGRLLCLPAFVARVRND